MELATSDRAAATRSALRAAVEAGDLDAAVALFAPDIAFHSPIVASRAFEGRDAVARLQAAVLVEFRDIHYTDEGEAGDTQVLSFRATVRGREIQGVDLLRVDADGLITDFTVLIRPMVGLALVAAVLGPHLASNRVTAVLVRAFSAPLAAILSLSERLVPRLIRMR